MVGFGGVRFDTGSGHAVLEAVAFDEELTFVVPVLVGCGVFLDDGTLTVCVALDNDVRDQGLDVLDALEELFLVASSLCWTFLGCAGVCNFNSDERG